MIKAWLYFTNNNFLPPTNRKEILDQPIFLNPQTKHTISNMYNYNHGQSI